MAWIWNRALGGALFVEEELLHADGEIVMVRDITFFSTCESNLLPFYGRCHVAYIPKDGTIAGLSKFARIVEVFARRLQRQQKLTDEVAQAIFEEVKPHGVAVVIQGHHMVDGSDAPLRTTSAALGSLLPTNGKYWDEFCALMQLQGLYGRIPEPGFTAVFQKSPSTPMFTYVEPESLPFKIAKCLCGTTHSGSENGNRSNGHAQGNGNCNGREEMSPAGTSVSGEALRRHDLGAWRKDQQNILEMEEAVRVLIKGMGDDPSREGLRNTPSQYVQNLLKGTEGYEVSLENLASTLKGHEELENVPKHPEPVVYLGVNVMSQCEHHLLPFYGRAHIALARSPGMRPLSQVQVEQVVEAFSRRLQVQERLTRELAVAFSSLSRAAGVMVVVEAYHMCMVARGVQQKSSMTLTLATSGSYDEHKNRTVFLSQIAASRR
eukprot:scaffold308_cov327-Pavlova_lutheri.AAC.44